MDEQDNSVVSPQVKLQIALGDLQMWKNTRWQLDMRLRVQKKIGGDQAIKEITKGLVEAEGAIDELETIVKEIRHEMKRPMPPPPQEEEQPEGDLEAALAEELKDQ